MRLTEEFAACMAARDAMWAADQRIALADNPSAKLMDAFDAARRRSDDMNAAFRVRLAALDPHGRAMDGYSGLVGRLIEATASWRRDRAPPGSEMALVAEIGRRLDALGGIEMMREAYYEACAENRCPHDIQIAWDGIGVWKA